MMKQRIIPIDPCNFAANHFLPYLLSSLLIKYNDDSEDEGDEILLDLRMGILRYPLF